jgi:MoaA/NifB/PqqE/SkfB family radical SAM enzyme
VDIIKNQKRLPHTIDFAITSQCPYHCPHCSYGKRKKEDLNTDEILTLIKEMKELGTAILGITGGEPLVRPDLEKIVAACSPELSTILYTTGFNFNRQRAKELYNAKISSIIVGIDSTDTKIQDEVRGKKGSLELGIQALQLCNEIGIYTGINTIATRERINNGELERIYELACSLQVGELRLNFPIATGRWAGCPHKQLKAEELEMLRSIKKRLNKKRSGPIVTTLAEYESEDFMGCNTGYQTVFIDSSGEVCPCDFTPLSFGNIKDTHLKDIWTQMGLYFPRPRADCLMREISHTIESDFFPLPPEKSKQLIPQLSKESPYPKIYKKLTKRN